MAFLNIATKNHVDGFARKWTHKGIAIFLDDAHKQFAVDFANVIVSSFVEQQQRQAMIDAEKKKAVIVDK